MSKTNKGIWHDHDYNTDYTQSSGWQIYSEQSKTCGSLSATRHINCARMACPVDIDIEKQYNP